MKDPGNRLILFGVIGVVLFYVVMSKSFNKNKKKLEQKKDRILKE